MPMRHVVGEVPQGGSPWPPIASYAFLSDCEVSALVAPTGNVEWMCLPRFDGPSIFGSLLDRDAGGFRLSPVDTTVPAGRRYLPGTLVLETTWSTSTGWIVVCDALLIGPWHHARKRSRTHRRTPTDTDADHVLLRSVRCVNGRVDVRMECEPQPRYGLESVTWHYDDEGYSSAVARLDQTPSTLRLTSDLRLGFEGGSARARSTMREGDTAFVALAWSEHAAPTTYAEASQLPVCGGDRSPVGPALGELPAGVLAPGAHQRRRARDPRRRGAGADGTAGRHAGRRRRGR